MVHCIRKKYDVFDTFKQWKTLVENESRRKLNCIILDDGGIYWNKEFDDGCNSYHKIHRENIVIGTLRENCVSE